MPIDLDTNEYVEYSSPPQSDTIRKKTVNEQDGQTTNQTDGKQLKTSLRNILATPSTAASTSISPLTSTNITASPGRSATTTDSSNSSSDSSNESSSYSLPGATNPVLFNGFLGLTKKPKKKKSPRNLASNGIYNPYNHYDDSTGGEGDDSSTVSSSGPGPAAVYIPSTMQSKAMLREKNKKKISSSFPIPVMVDEHSDKNDVSVLGNEDDDASQRTPIPLAPPTMPNTGLPSTFLRDRTNATSSSTIASNESTISSEDGGENLSITKRNKRELENVGRLVVAAKHQHSFAQAWFAAGTNSSNLNALPPPVKKPSTDKPPKQVKRVRLSEHTLQKAAQGDGPIDVDSGELWIGEAGSDDSDEKAKKAEVGSFAFTTQSMKTKRRGNLSKNFLSFGVPEDEDLTLYTEKNFWGRIVCTIGNTRCSSLALLILALGVAVAVGGTVVTILYFIPNNKAVDQNTIFPSTSPTLSMSPSISIVPTFTPSGEPSRTPSAQPSSMSSSKPSITPTSKPSSSPSSQPTSKPSSVPSFKPSPHPSSLPTSNPTVQPTLSRFPSSQPSSMPSKFFSSVTFVQEGDDIGVPEIGGVTGIDESDETGYSVSISKNGDIIAGSSRYYPSVRTGSVTIYQRGYSAPDTIEWVQMGQPLVGYNDGEEFGHSIDLSDDGKTIVVGSPQLVIDFNVVGAVRVFKYDDTTDEWSPFGQELLGDQFYSGEFGLSVSISGNGKIVVVGEPNYGFFSFGQVTAFGYNDITGQWDTLSFSNEGNTPSSKYGSAVAISGDGTVIAASSFLDCYVEMFQYDLATGQWNYIGDIKEEVGACEFESEFSISLSYNGRVLAMGSPRSKVVYEDESGEEETFVDSGQVSVYQYGNPTLGETDIIDSTWHLIGEEIIGVPNPGQRSGSSVSLSHSGTDIAIGAPKWGNIADGLDIGQVVVYKWNGATWVAAQALNGLRPSEHFGHDVSLSENGDKLLVGGPGSFSTSGVTRVFNLET